MKRIVLAILMIAGLCEAVTAQDLQQEILVEQYMLEAQQALADTTIFPPRQRRISAIQAYQKIEALNVEPPLEFYFFYGKVLVVEAAAWGEHGGASNGISMLKQYVLKGGKNADYYTAALGLLAMVFNYQPYVLIDLIDASGEDDTEIVRILIAAGADVNARDNDGETLLIWAADHGHTEFAKTLIAAGADLNVKDNNGERPRRFAIEEGENDIARLLKEAGAKK